MIIKPNISIIVPVYNVEKTIERCARSLFEQSFNDIEYIFVNDCTTDSSIQILKKVLNDFPKRKNQITILDHQLNRGVAAARNTGLDKARGDYVIQIDSDDWVEKTMIEELYNTAVKNNSDFVWSDFYVGFYNDKNKLVYRKQDVPQNPASCIKEILTGSFHAGLWNKLMKRDICVANNIRFPEGINICEDIVFVISYLLHANNIKYVSKAFYHYVQYPDSLTNVKTRQYFETQFKVVQILEEILHNNEYNEYLLIHKAKIKRDVLFSNIFENQEYLNIYPEAISYMYKNIGILSKSIIRLANNKHRLLAKIFISMKSILIM